MGTAASCVAGGCWRGRHDGGSRGVGVAEVLHELWSRTQARQRLLRLFRGAPESERRAAHSGRCRPGAVETARLSHWRFQGRPSGRNGLAPKSLLGFTRARPQARGHGGEAAFREAPPRRQGGTSRVGLVGRVHAPQPRVRRRRGRGIRCEPRRRRGSAGAASAGGGVGNRGRCLARACPLPLGSRGHCLRRGSLGRGGIRKNRRPRPKAADLSKDHRQRTGT